MRDSDIAYLRLKNMILKAKLKPGEILNEPTMMDTLGLGRTPVREALNRLSCDGLVIIIPRKGIIVSQISLDDLQSIFELRYVFEDLIGQLVPKKIIEQDLEFLRKIINVKTDDFNSEFDKNIQIDQSFHLALVKITGNRFLEEDYQRIYNASLRLLYLNKAKMQNLSETVIECEEILKNLINENGNKLSKMLKAHLTEFKKKVLSDY